MISGIKMMEGMTEKIVLHVILFQKKLYCRKKNSVLK